MPMMMLIFLIAVLGVLAAVGYLGYVLGRQQLPPGRGSSEDRRLVDQQMERIELLEADLARLREQADFTEKLLEERGRDAPGES